MADKKESQLTSATILNDADTVTGLQGGINKNFSGLVTKQSVSTYIDANSNFLKVKGDINLPADFPTLAAVKIGWLYAIKTPVTDNDPTKTNTGQSFVLGEIFWNGTNWSVLEASSLLPTANEKAALDGAPNALTALNPVADMQTVNSKQSALEFDDSLTNIDGVVTLVNDNGTPGNSKYYGTDGGGVLGYHNLFIDTSATFSLIWDASIPFSTFYTDNNIIGRTNAIVVELNGFGHTIDKLPAAATYDNLFLVTFTYRAPIFNSRALSKAIIIANGALMSNPPNLGNNVFLISDSATYVCSNPMILDNVGMYIGNGSELGSNTGCKFFQFWGSVPTPKFYLDGGNIVTDNGDIINLNNLTHPLTINLINQSKLLAGSISGTASSVINIQYDGSILQGALPVSADFVNITTAVVNYTQTTAASRMGNDSAVTGVTIADALNTLNTNKQNNLTNPITGTGTSGQLAQFNGTSTITGVTALANGVTATTQSAGDNSTKVATTAYLDTKLGAANGIATLNSIGVLPDAQVPAFVLGDKSYQGTWDASGGVYPLLPSNGQYWTIIKAGTMGGTVYAINDETIYYNSVWSKIDGTATTAQMNAWGSAWTGSSTITTLGTIITGTWHGDVIGSSYGGAGTISGILKANGSGTVSQASAGSDYLTPTGNGSGLTGLTATQVGLTNVTNDAQTKAAIVPNTAPNPGYILVGNTGFYLPVSVSGDGTLNSSGALNITKSGGVAFGTGAFATIANYVPTSTTVNGHALSGNISVTTTDLSLNNLTNDTQTKATIVPNTAPNKGQFLVGNSGGTAYGVSSYHVDAITVSSNGQTSFTSAFSVAPLCVLDVIRNGIVYAQNGTDFSVSGQNLTWLNPGSVTTVTTDTLLVRYFG